MKNNRFLLLSVLAVILVLGGGVYKHTALRALRTELTYQYKMHYTVEVRDVDENMVDMYFKGMGLYLDPTTVAGSVEKAVRVPAASGKQGKYDVTLSVAASGSRLTPDGYGDYRLTKDNRYSFLSRFISFDGYITEIDEE